jgi:hypothetical protein
MFAVSIDITALVNHEFPEGLRKPDPPQSDHRAAAPFTIHCGAARASN